MGPYLPNIVNLGDVFVAWLVGVCLLGVGSGLTAGSRRPEMSILLGWGGWCLVATLWLVFTPLTLAVPATIFALFAIFGLTRRIDWRSLGRAFILSLPLWLVMAPIRPAEPDTWLNLLPNAVYLVDHGDLPLAGRPPSYSFLPAAPYNTQFLSYLGGLIDPGYPAAGMSLDNLLLLVIAGLGIARMLANDAPRWRDTALGLLLATLFNPGFVPRIHLASYGETGLAVTALFAAILFTSAKLRGGAVFALGLTLAAMVEVKQSGFGLVAAVAAAGFVTLLAERRLPITRAALTVLGAVLPALLLFATWRWFVAHAGVDELKPLPFDAWQWRNIPAILASMARTAGEKGIYFTAVGLSFAALPILLRRAGWTTTTRLLVFNLALFLCYTGFLILTYIGHFPGAWSTEAHSFFRYETHLSLVLMLTLALAVRDLAAILAPDIAAKAVRSIPIAAGAVGLILLAPIGFGRLLRFDLAMPQPLVWDLAKDLAPLLDDGARLALLLPDDNGSVATMLGGVLADTAPRRRDLDLRPIARADPAALDQARDAGYNLAFVSCAPNGLDGVPAGHAALLALTDGVWRPRAIWAYPEDANRGRWQHILAWPPLCRAG